MRPGARSRSPTGLSTSCPPGHPLPCCWQRSHPDRCSDLPDRSARTSRSDLAPAASGLPNVPRLTGPQDTTAEIQALHPDLIIDYGTVSPRYKQLAQDTQKKTGIPTLLVRRCAGSDPSGRPHPRANPAPAGSGRSGCPCRRGDPGAADAGRTPPERVLCSRRRRSAGDRAKHRRDGDLRPPGLAGCRAGRHRHLPPDDDRDDPDARSGHHHPVGPGGEGCAREGAVVRSAGGA